MKEQEERASKVSLMERIVRVEEALLAQGKVIKALQREMDKRFEAVDKRFESLQREMDKRFDSLGRRFTFMQWPIAGGFSFLAILITIVNFLK